MPTHTMYLVSMATYVWKKIKSQANIQYFLLLSAGYHKKQAFYIRNKDPCTELSTQSALFFVSASFLCYFSFSKNLTTRGPKGPEPLT